MIPKETFRVTTSKVNLPTGQLLILNGHLMSAQSVSLVKLNPQLRAPV